ncbi:MAG TPA: ABC transporter permease subunit [Verrucomicrobiota bacterium]|nr:ABC transporter permease subunit [Verrucomicrobiota bacterium]HNU49716.1 ABC transporter permease subunit [Verrucomicrobiota bacterium]
MERELRVAARRPGPFWARLAAALVAVVIGGLGLWWEGDVKANLVLGAGLFGALGRACFVFALLAGPVFTADVLSEERREGTLGLLFLTDLRGYDVVLGKLAAASVTSVFSLLATLPVLAIPILLGGVSLAEFGRTALALGTALFFSLAVGMMVSALCDQARSAFALAGLILFIAGVVLPFLEETIERSSGGATLLGLFLSINPTSAMVAAGMARPAAVGDFWLSVVGVNLVGGLMLMVAGHWTAGGWREAGVSQRFGRWRARWEQWALGTGTQRRVLRTRLLDQNPMAWLAGRHRWKRQVLWGAVGVGLVAWVLGAFASGPLGTDWGMTLTLAMFFQGPIKWLMASEASQRWVIERQTGALELILTTPLTVGEILRGHWLGLWRLFGVPVVVLLGMESGLLLWKLPDGEGQDLAAMTVVMMGVFVWDMYTLGWVGLWQGLRRRRANAAFLATAFRVLVIPWLLMLGGVFLVGTAGWGTLPVLWFLACGACNVWFLQVAQQHLREGLRWLASEGGNPTGNDGERSSHGR